MRGVVVTVVVVVGVGVLLGSDVVHLDHVAALEAALDGALAGDGQPVDLVGVCGETGATGVLLITGAVDDDGVFDGALAGGIKGTHVEDVNALHLSDELQTLETGGLVEIGGNGTGLGTWSKEVLLGLDLVEGQDLALLLGSPLLLIGANDGGREGALGEGESASRRAPCKGGGCTLEEHCPGGDGVDDAGRLEQEREFGGLRLGEFEAALVRPPVIGWLSYPIGSRMMMSQPF